MFGRACVCECAAGLAGALSHTTHTDLTLWSNTPEWSGLTNIQLGKHLDPWSGFSLGYINILYSKDIDSAGLKL